MLLLLLLYLHASLSSAATVLSPHTSQIDRDNLNSLDLSSENLCERGEKTCEAPSKCVFVTCSGLLNPSSLGELVPASTTHLTVRHSNLIGLHGEHLHLLPELLHLDIQQSQVVLEPLVWDSSLPLQQLSFQQCWSRRPGSDGAEHRVGDDVQQPHLVLLPRVWSQLWSLRQLALVQCSIVVDEQQQEAGGSRGFALLPPNCHLTIQDGEFECPSTHEYLLELRASARASVSSNTTCFVFGHVDKFDTFYTFNGKPLLDVLRLTKSLEKCPPKCKCALLGFRSIERPLLSVNCYGAGLTGIPATIPPLASTFNISNNKLRSIDSLFTNPHYSRLANCDFSDNSIYSINGSALVHYLNSRSHDIKFDLRNNSLSTFPVWELNSIYYKAHRSGEKHLPAFDLSSNPWDCENCSFSPFFKSFVYDNMYYIRDHVAVRCSSTGDLVLHRDFNRQCNPPGPLLLPIDYLIIFMALILAIMLADFAYNFYQYRRHGKLPWIVRNCKTC